MTIRRLKKLYQAEFKNEHRSGSTSDDNGESKPAREVDGSQVEFSMT